MKRRTLDLLFSTGGLVLAGLLLVAGVVLTSNASFANTYVTDQLSAQNISFKAADQLTDEEKQLACVTEYAGQKLTTGKQAECYANYIGVHLQSTADGKTYAELGAPQTALRQQVAQARETNAPNLADLEKQLADISGLLLTSYGFSEFGTKAGQAATITYLAAALMALLAIFGFIHAFMTPRTRAFAPVDEPTKKETINV